jgi:type VI secretion system protein ImpK
MRLVEYFFDLFYYTSFLKSLDFSQLPYENVAKRYKQILSASLQSVKKAGRSEREWGMGLFPVCAWIDETVLCSDWSERGKWLQNPLQLVFFRTMNAGEEFFLRLAALDNSAREVREVYDYCLALGFKGKYYQPGDGGTLDEIARSNLMRITGEGKVEFPATCFPEAYADSFDDRGKRPLRWNVSWGRPGRDHRSRGGLRRALPHVPR